LFHLFGGSDCMGERQFGGVSIAGNGHKIYAGFFGVERGAKAVNIRLRKTGRAVSINNTANISVVVAPCVTVCAIVIHATGDRTFYPGNGNSRATRAAIMLHAGKAWEAVRAECHADCRATFTAATVRRAFATFTGDSAGADCYAVFAVITAREPTSKMVEHG
jgi:hypothetical protein